MACFTAFSSSCPRRRYTISSFFQTVGGSEARSPEQVTSSDSSFCRFFPRMLTMSVAVQAPRAINTSSIGPGAVFEWRSESMLMACPEGLVATNFPLAIHFTDAVCMLSPQLKNIRSNRDARIDIRWFRLSGCFSFHFSCLRCAAGRVFSKSNLEENSNAKTGLKNNTSAHDRGNRIDGHGLGGA